MRTQTSQLYLFLFLLGAVLFWAGCDPEDEDPDPGLCEDDVPVLNYGDYCDPIFEIYRELEFGNNFGLILPDFCLDDYSSSYLMKVEVPLDEIIYFHQYLNFPGSLITEFIGSNCDDTYDLLNACTASTKLVETFEIDASGYSTVYIRVAYRGIDGYVPGSRSTDNLTFAAFSEAFVPTVLDDDAGNEVLVDCDGTRTNRIILTPGVDGGDPFEVAEFSGLPVISCECARGELVTIEAPAGVDMNTVRPKIKEQKPDVDTVRTTFDFIIQIPAFQQLSGTEPNDDPTVISNECLLFSDPDAASSPNGGVTVTIVDSGVDNTTFAGTFEQFRNFGLLPTCGPIGPLGADYLRADFNPDDEVGHGTAVASAFLSGLKSDLPVTLINNKFFGPAGGTLFDALCASHAAIEAETDILNLSWGFFSNERPEAMDKMLRRAVEGNIAVVVSAGNDGISLDAQNYWPASFGTDFANLLAVGSFEQQVGFDPILTPWTNRGAGSIRVAAFYTTETLALGGGTFFPVGTSISAPIVTRRLTQILAGNFGMSPEELINNFLAIEAQSSTSLAGQIENNEYLPLPSPVNGCELVND